MVHNEKAKTTALVLTAVCIILSAVHTFTGFPQLPAVGICKDCTILARFAYPFFHASLLHALVNCWCLLSLVFYYDVSLCYLLIAYVAAVTFPVGILAAVVPAASAAGVPTVGLSAVIFALLGMVSFQAKRKALLHSFVLSSIAFGYLLHVICSVCGYAIATPNSTLHLYGYVAGLIVGFLNSPAHVKG